jgi:methyl-accepting chemotaxis protein
MTAAVPPGTPPARTRSARTWWGDRGVKTKVLAPVAVAALAAGTIGVLGLQAMSSTQDRINSLYVDVTVPVNDLGKIQASLEHSNFLLSELLLHVDATELEKVEADIATADALVDERFAAYTATDMTGREEARDGFAAALDAWRTTRDTELIPLAKSINNGAQFVAARDAEATAEFGAAMDNLDALKNIEEAAGETFVEDAQSAYAARHLDRADPRRRRDRAGAGAVRRDRGRPCGAQGAGRDRRAGRR